MRGTTWIVIGIGALVLVVLYAALTGDDGDDSLSAPQALPESQAPTEDCIYRPNQPSYTGADLSGYASYLAKDDPNNCRQSFIDRVRRFAADTCTQRALVYPADTSEFLGYLRSACTAAGTPIR